VRERERADDRGSKQPLLTLSLSAEKFEVFVSRSLNSLLLHYFIIELFSYTKPTRIDQSTQGWSCRPSFYHVFWLLTGQR